MVKQLSKKEMFAMNTIATKKVDSQYLELANVDEFDNIEYESKKIKRIRYLKICWNCGCAYESSKFNSFGCSKRCSWNINYKLKRGIAPPANMAYKTRLKNIKVLLEEFGY
ncbi:MAG: hypothetical protein A2046_06850 [Bacteroidetes bacterium GWA2_30_7]|nr:MAG: hypothetical protein A2046_06850 [Bacteroidetes bacterium GWA2_30_7]